MAQSLRALIVEDNLEDAELVLRELRHAGFDTVYERVDTEAAYLAHLHEDLDIILSDYALPQFNGLRALELLKERKLEIPFILVSGTIGEETAVQAMKQGAEDYLLKDRLARLGPAISHALEQSRIRRETREASETLALRERALGAVSQGVLISDENRLVIYANPAFTSITGYEQHEILGRRCSLLQGADTDPETIIKMRTALDANLPFEGEILNYRKDGSPFWNELSLTPIRDNNRGPVKFIGTLRDITSRKLAREALLKSEEHLRKERAQLRALIDSIPDLIFFKNTESVFLGCNAAFENYLGLREDDIIGKTDFDINKDTAAFYRSKDREMLQSGKPQTTDEWIYNNSGGKGYFETVKTPYYGPRGESLGLVAVSREVTGRKRAEDELRTALERQKIAAQAAQLGIWELDVISKKATWDDQMYAIYGLAADQDTSEGVDRWFRHMETEDIAKCERIFEEALYLGRDFFDVEFHIRRADNKARRTIRSMGMIKRDEAGHFTRMIGVNRDVTQEREHEQELASSLAKEKELAEKARAGEQAKGEFLAAMSHELRTPMNGILGFAELLDQSEDLPIGCRQYSQTIMQSGEALLRILDDILDFSQLEAGRLRIEATRFDPYKVVDDVRHLLSRHAQEKDVCLEVSVAPETPHVLIGDAGRIRQVLVNLVGNAIKFTDHGSVSIHLQQVADSENFAFRVKDTGSGISQEKLESIFQPFTQADSSISRRHGGTGLGLTITRRLTELLGGSITVSSQEGEGSEFLAIIPLKIPDPTAEGGVVVPVEVLDANFAHEHPLNILIVEDDKINLRLIQTLVRRLGYEPLTAQNGRDAVEVYRSSHPDCILMDLQMPEMDGIEATSEIRATERSHQLKDAYIFALTANILPADKKRCFEAGMNEYLNKPVRINALAKLLAAAENFHRQHQN